MTDEQRKAKIAALVKERAGCEQMGLKDRVEAVDRELRALGADAGHPVKRAEKRTPARKKG